MDRTVIELLGSRVTVRVLKILAEKRSTTITGLIRETNTNTRTLAKTLEKLRKLGLIVEKYPLGGTYHIVEINMKNKKAEKIFKLIKELEELIEKQEEKRK